MVAVYGSTNSIETHRRDPVFQRGERISLMLKYAWAYQGQSSAEYITYPVQTIDMRVERVSPSARVANAYLRAKIKRQMPATHAASGQLYIFSTR